MPKKSQKKKKPVRQSKKVEKTKRSSVRDVIGIALITIAVLIVAAVISYNPNDPPNGSAEEVSNRLGLAGAWIAFTLIHFTFGRWISLVIPVLIALFSLELIRRKGFGLTVKTSLILVIASVLASTSWELIRIFKGMHGILEVTGLAGYGLAGLMTGWLGHTGSFIVLAGVILIFLTIVLGIRWAGPASIVHSAITGIGHLLGKMRIPKVAPIKKAKAEPRVNRMDRVPNKVVEVEDPEPGIEELAAEMPARDIEIVKDEYEPTGALNSQIEQKKETDEKQDKRKPPEYILPPVELLNLPDIPEEDEPLDDNALRQKAALLEDRLLEFGVKAEVIQIHPGPVVTRFDLKPAPGVKVGRIASLQDDLALSLAAPAIRIQAPIPGAGAVGIEIPNKSAQIVFIREIVESAVFQDSDSPLLVALGRTAKGDVYVTDLAKLPHLLIAGTTGSGKSICINTIIASILMRNKPEDVMIAMVDPKKLELSAYAELRKHHLLFLEENDEVIATESKNAVMLMQSIVHEMEERYTRLAEAGARNINEFNNLVEDGKVKPDEDGNEPHRLPYLVVIIDELADLMLTAARDIEEPIARLAQMARAVGIHLVVATQRPSVDVITGVIKANFPARIAFMVASKIDSRTILDRPGAETLLGKGDCLILTGTYPHPVRLHAAYVSTDEVHKLIAHVARQPAFIKQCQLVLPATTGGGSGGGITPDEGRDVLFEEAVRLVVRHQQGSVSLLQRRLKIGYSRAGRLLDQLEQAGVVGPFEGSKAREVMIQPDDVEEFLQ